MTAIDCPFKLAQPMINRLKHEKIEAVGRYLNPDDPDKILGAAEALKIRKARLKLFSIWQTGGGKHSYFTEKQGRKDAQSAAYLATEAGQPSGTPIFFKVDYDALPADHAAITRYFSSIKNMIQGYAVGVFGSYAVIELLASTRQADFFYQTSAWSAGKLSQKAHIYFDQDSGIVASIGTGPVRILKPGAFWSSSFHSQRKLRKAKIYRKASKNKVNMINELMEGTYTASEYSKNLLQSDLPDSLQTFKQSEQQNGVPSVRRYPGKLIQLGSKGKPVRSIQEAIGIRVDGFYGPRTKAAVENYQRRCRLYPDGIVGPITWRLLLKVLFFSYSIPGTFLLSYD